MAAATTIAQEGGIKRTVNRYAVGVLAALVALLLRRLVAPLVGTQLVYMVLWPAVVFSSWYCGVGPAIITMVLGVVGAWFWFLPHLHSAWLQHPPAEITSLIGFLIVSALIIIMGEANRRARERERRSAEEAMAATAKFEALFQQATVFAGVTTLDGIVLDANRLSLEMCGYRAEDVLGKPFWECGWWQGQPESQTKVRAATPQAAHGISYRDILPYRWADGTERMVDFSLHPIRDSRGQIIFLHPTGIDITDLKNAEENYRALAESLEEKVRVRTVEVEQRTQQLRDLSRRLLQTQDDERRRIARELHDSAGQYMASIQMNLDALLREAVALPAPQRERISDSIAMLERCNSEIRTLSYLLHPPLLDELGLRSALSWYLEGFSERSGIKVELQVPDDLPRMTPNMETVIFRVVQQSLVNIHRHSGSHIARVRIDCDAERIELKISDEGKGMPPETLAGINAGTGLVGVGVAGMRERVIGMGGKFQVRSRNDGTMIQISLPVTRSGNAAASGA